MHVGDVQTKRGVVIHIMSLPIVEGVTEPATAVGIQSYHDDGANRAYYGTGIVRLPDGTVTDIADLLKRQ